MSFAGPQFECRKLQFIMNKLQLSDTKTQHFKSLLRSKLGAEHVFFSIEATA